MRQPQYTPRMEPNPETIHAPMTPRYDPSHQPRRPKSVAKMKISIRVKGSCPHGIQGGVYYACPVWIRP